MIPKIFPTIDNIQPYKSKFHSPYTEIVVYNFPYSVKTHGPSTSHYAFPTFSLTADFVPNNLKWSSTSPLIKFFTGKSYPVELAPHVNESEQFGILYLGFFKPETTTCTFFLKGTGRARLSIRGVTTGTVDLGLTRDTVQTLHVTGLDLDFSVANLLSIFYQSPNKIGTTPNVFSVTWKNNLVTKEIPLAAGNYQSTQDLFAADPPATLTHASKIEVSYGKKQSSSFTFTVPLVSSSASLGYKYIKDGNYLQNVKNEKTIKQFRYIELHTGYKYSDNSISTITKFTGQIRNIELVRSANNRNEAIVTCHDWSSFLLDSINEGYPDLSDYLAFDYLDPSLTSGVAGDTKPRTFDGWKLEDAIDCLLVNAYIDPSILWKRKKYLNVDDVIDTGYYLVHSKNQDSPILLDKSFNYGNTFSTENVDDKYIWQFSIGESIFDNVQKLMDNYGLEFGFNNDGHFYTTSVRTPIGTKGIDDMTFTGSWVEKTDPKMVYGVSNETSVNGDTVLATYIGRTSRLVFDVAPTFGTIHIKLSNPTLGMVATADFSTSHTTIRSYLDGVDDTVGLNPCAIDLGIELNYGYYSLNVTHKTGGTVSINSVFTYDVDSNTPVDTFYSGDEGTNRAVIVKNLSSTSDAANIRNDITVVGRLKGLFSSLSLSDTEQPLVNPHNVVSQHVIARAIDRSSIGSVSHTNYVGRQLKIIIIEPKVATEDRALWMATETLKRYNEHKKSLNPNMSVVGQPLLEVGDFVQAKDVYTNVLGTIHDLWINSIVETYSNNQYVTSLELESFKPWESYFKYPFPSLKRFDNNVFTNVKLLNSGVEVGPKENFIVDENQTVMGTVYGKFMSNNMDNLSLVLTELDEVLPRIGYLKIRGEVIRYKDRTFGGVRGISDTTDSTKQVTVFATVFFKSLDRGMYNTSTISDLTAHIGEYISLESSPYIGEEYSIAPGIQFDLLYPGYLRVAVYNHTGHLVDVLSLNSDSASLDENSGWEFVQPGTYFYAWNMVDRVGTHNEINTGVFRNEGSTILDFPTRNDLGPPDGFGEWRDYYGNIGFPEQRYKIGPGFYAQNIARKKYGKFTMYVQYLDLSGQITKELKTVQHKRNIFSVLRPDGEGVAFSIQTQEALTLDFTPVNPAFPNGEKTTDIDYIDLSDLWWSQTLGYHVGGIGLFYDKFYTGIENQGKGMAIKIRNKFDISRLANIKIERYVMILKYAQYLNSSTGDTHEDLWLIDQLTDNPLDSSGFNWVVQQKTLKIYIPGPNIAFVTPKAATAIQNTHPVITRIGSDGRELGKTYLIAIALSHLHLIRITSTDFSGRKSIFGRSIWWVSPQVHNTRQDFDNNNVKRNIQGQPYEKILMRRGGRSGYTEINLPIAKGWETYPDIVKRRLDRTSYITANSIFGVVVRRY